MHITRPLAALAAATLLAGLTSAPANAAPAFDTKPVKIGAGWLSDQVTDGLVHNEQFKFDDVGLSIDVALGLDAAGKQPTVVKAITKAVAKNVGSYTAFPPSVYAGATAKAAVLALERDKNPRSFGGVDLVTQLEDRVATAAPITGRIEDAYDPSDPFGGDFANVIGQAYAAQALSLAGSPKAASVTRFLLRQQCKAGYFRLSFTADKSATDQTCNGAAKAERAPDTDATAIAALALLLDVKQTDRTFAALIRARDWLVDHQHANGSFGGGTATETANTNSTGLAGRLLWLSGRPKQAALAAAWVRSLQVAAENPCLKALKGETGGIAYDLTAYEDGRSKGIKSKTSDQWRRASAQALPLLQYAPRADGPVTVSAPAAVPAGTTFKIALGGVAPGQRVCVTGAGQAFEYVPGRNALSKVTLQTPGSAGVRTYTVYVGSQHRDVTVRVTN
jgi:hypothetical protein